MTNGCCNISVGIAGSVLQYVTLGQRQLEHYEQLKTQFALDFENSHRLDLIAIIIIPISRLRQVRFFPEHTSIIFTNCLPFQSIS